MVHESCILRGVLNENMPPTRRTRSTSTLADPGHIPADLELGRLYVKDLRSICSRLNLSTTGGRAALIKRIDEARQNTGNLPGTPPPIQDGGEHIQNQNPMELQFQQLQRQVQELLDREPPQDGLLSATQLTQVQSIVQGSLNEAIEKAASAAAQAAVRAFSGSPPQAPDPATHAGESSVDVTPPSSAASTSNSLLESQVSSLGNCSRSATDTEMDSVHELPAKPVKEILTVEFMELSKLLPKNFNALNPPQDEPLTLTVENSIIKVNKAKTTSITDISEWTTAFSAYMGVLISKFPHRVSELLEYMSLIRYAARYHKGLGWCVYDIKFRQKAATNKALKWSTIDSQLWLKTFTVAPSLLKEDIGVFQSGPSSSSTSKGPENRTCHNFNRGVPCARTPCSYAHKCNRSGCGKDHPGIKCPTNYGTEKPLHREGKLPPPPPSPKAPATEKNSFGGIVTPVKVETLYQALSDHPEREFVNKLCLELREGARIGYSGPRSPRFSNNLPTAFLNPEVVTANLNDEVSKGRTMGPFSTPPFTNFQVSPIGLVPKKHSDKFRTIFHLSYPKSGTSSINYFIEKDDFSLQYITIDNAITAIQTFGQGCYMGKTDIESAFRLIPVHPDDWELLGMFWNGQYYFDKVLPFGLRSAPYIFNQLSDAIEWILLNKCSISFVCHILDDFLIVEPPCPTPPLDSLCRASLSSMILTFKTLNIPISASKTEGHRRTSRGGGGGGGSPPSLENIRAKRQKFGQ